MKAALTLLTLVTETPTKREVITVTHYDGRTLALRLQELYQEKRTGQLIVNLSQGSPTTAQWVEKSLTSSPD